MLILTTSFSIYIFSFHEEILLPFPQVSILTRNTFHKSIKPRMQTKNVANNSHKQFYVLLNTIPDLLKKNPLLWKFLNSESTAYFLHETFYHTHTPLFSIKISAATVKKVTKYSTYYIIHNSYDVASKYQIMKELVKLSYLVGSVDKNNAYFHMACLSLTTCIFWNIFCSTP